MALVCCWTLFDRCYKQFCTIDRHSSLPLSLHFPLLSGINLSRPEALSYLISSQGRTIAAIFSVSGNDGGNLEWLSGPGPSKAAE